MSSSPGRSEKTSLRLAAAQTPLNETLGGDDAFMWAEQVQVGTTLGKHQVQASLASYAFQRIDQFAIALSRQQIIALNTNATTRGPDGEIDGFLSDFHILDLIGQATLATGRAQYPVLVIAEWAYNTRAATDEDAAFWIVGGIGRAAVPRTASASYTYADRTGRGHFSVPVQRHAGNEHHRPGADGVVHACKPHQSGRRVDLHQGARSAC